MTLGTSNYLLNDTGQLNSHDGFLKSCLVLKEKVNFLKNMLLDFDKIDVKLNKNNHSIRDFRLV